MSEDWNAKELILVIPVDCPACGCRMTATFAVTNIGEPGQPKSGDLSVCAHCLSVSIFDDDGIRLANSDECEGVPDWLRVKIAKVSSVYAKRPS